MLFILKSVQMYNKYLMNTRNGLSFCIYDFMYVKIICIILIFY